MQGSEKKKKNKIKTNSKVSMVEYKNNNNKKKISIINCKERKKVGHKKK